VRWCPSTECISWAHAVIAYCEAGGNKALLVVDVWGDQLERLLPSRGILKDLLCSSSSSSSSMVLVTSRAVAAVDGIPSEGSTELQPVPMEFCQQRSRWRCCAGTHTAGAAHLMWRFGWWRH
jgi:hypothetical protein